MSRRSRSPDRRGRRDRSRSRERGRDARDLGRDRDREPPPPPRGYDDRSRGGGGRDFRDREPPPPPRGHDDRGRERGRSGGGRDDWDRDRGGDDSRGRGGYDDRGGGGGDEGRPRRSPPRDVRRGGGPREPPEPKLPAAPPVDLSADVTDDEIAMMKMMGIPVGFDTTQGNYVDDERANLSAAKIATKRQGRQYMNRKGGFNRPLPSEKSGERQMRD